MTTILKTRHKTSDGEILPGKTYEVSDEDNYPAEVDMALHLEMVDAYLAGLTVEGAEVLGDQSLEWRPLPYYPAPPPPLTERVGLGVALLMSVLALLGSLIAYVS